MPNLLDGRATPFGDASRSVSLLDRPLPEEECGSETPSCPDSPIDGHPRVSILIVMAFWVSGLRRGLARIHVSRRGESGAAMVEMAFIFSLLVMLLVGVVTSALALGQKNSIENAAREASRYAATYPAPSSDPGAPATWQEWLQDVADVARAAAQGNLDSAIEGEYICVAHINSGLRLEDIGGAQSLSSGACYSDGLSDSRVQVVARRDSEISAAFFSIDVTLNGPATARYEREE